MEVMGVNVVRGLTDHHFMDMVSGIRGSEHNNNENSNGIGGCGERLLKTRKAGKSGGAESCGEGGEFGMLKT